MNWERYVARLQGLNPGQLATVYREISQLVELTKATGEAGGLAQEPAKPRMEFREAHMDQS